MNVKHTLGPWEADRAKDRDCPYHQIDAPTPAGLNRRFPYTVADTLNRVASITPEEDQANAHLIAAAPEIFAVAENAMRLLRDLGFHQANPQHPIWEAWQRARAKAEGQL